MDFHLDRLITGQVLHFIFEDTGHPHFLAGVHVLVIQHQSRFFKRSVSLRIPFRLSIGRLGIDIGVFTVVDGSDLDSARIAGIHGFLHLSGNAVHFDHLGTFRRTGLVQIGNRSFFPRVSYHGKAYNLHLGFCYARIQISHPEPRIQRLGQNGLVIATGRRHDGIVLVQGNTPLAPAILQLFKIGMVRTRQVYAVAHKTNVRIQRTIFVDIFRIVESFTGVVFGSIDMHRRIAFVFQIFVVIVPGNIRSRSI